MTSSTPLDKLNEPFVNCGRRGHGGSRPRLAVSFNKATMKSIGYIARALAVPRAEVVRRLVDRGLEGMGLPR